MWVVTNETIGADTMTFAASSLTLRARSIATIRENPINATAEE